MRPLRTIVAGAFLALLPAVPASAACHIASFEGDPYSAAEAAGTVTITVSNNGGAGVGSIDYKTVDKSAKAGQDYVSKSGTLAFAPGDGEQSFDVTIINDSKNEKAETFQVELSNPQGCFTTIEEKTATVTITDDDKKTETPTPTPTSTATPTKSSTPKPKPPATSPSPSPSGSPTTPSPSAVAQARTDGGGLSGGAVGGIVAATVVAGGAAAFWVRRRFLT